MKMTIKIMLCIALCLCINGCSNKNNINIKFSENTFSESYKQAIQFDSIKNDIINYLNEVIIAYNKSDKKTSSSFNISNESKKYEENIRNYLKDKDFTIDKSRYAGLKLQQQCIKVMTIVSGIELNKTGRIEDSSSDFEKLKNSLIDISNEFSSEIDFNKMLK